MVGHVHNLSGADLAVIYSDGGTRQGHVLEDGQRTPDNIQPEAIFHVPFDDHLLRGQHYGFHLEPDCETYVYRRSSRWAIFGPTEHDLHCLPPDPSRLEPAYTPAIVGDFDFISIAIDPTWSVPAEAQGVLDGLNEVDFKASFNLFSRPKTARYIRTTIPSKSQVWITERIRFKPASSVTAADIAAVKVVLQNALAGYWNHTSVPQATDDQGGQWTLRFRAEVVDDHEDRAIAIEVHPAGAKQANNWERWWTNIIVASVAHEFGHLVGLMDEYYLFDRSTSKAVTCKDKQQAERDKYSNRFAERLPNCVAANLMEDPHGVVAPGIDQRLVDSVFTGEFRQVLCLRSQNCA